MLPVTQVFIGFFLLILLMTYLIPAGLAYGYFYHWRNKSWNAQKIQKNKAPIKEIMYRDIRWSLLTVFIFAVLSTALYYLVNAGYGLLYYDIADYGWIYLPASFFIALILHDFYFYWMHRLMHHSKVFKFVHLLHHKTTTPTPWTIYAFQPLEAVVQFSIIYILVFILPLHPIVLFLIIAYNVIANVGGHCGFEFTSPKNADHWLMKYLNTVTHHDLHHANCTHNYSQYFNFLDRWYGTFRER